MRTLPGTARGRAFALLIALWSVALLCTGIAARANQAR